MGLEAIGKILLIAGIGVAVFGLVLILGERIPFLGRLPGDIFIRRGNVSIYVPLATFIILSLVLTVLLNAFTWLLRR